MEPAQIIFIALVAVGLILIFKTVRIVPQGAEWTLENFGRYSKTLRPGLHFVIPIYQSISNKVDMRERVICLLYTSPSPRDATLSRMPSSA